MTDANGQIVRRLFACMDAKDHAGVLALLHEDVRWRFMFSEGAASVPQVGHAAVRDYVLKGSAGVFRDGDPRIHVDAIVSHGDLVMAETRGSGARVDGVPYVNRYAWAFDLAGGKVIEVREYMDTLYISKFLGLPTGE